jgi:hypothetical protein
MVTATRPTTGKIDPQLIQQAKRVNIIDLAAQVTTLRKKTSPEWMGACPRCGGTDGIADRFYCTADWFTCRKCRDNVRGDVIEYTQWLHGCDFKEAVGRLTNGSTTGISTAQPRQVTQPRQKAAQPQEWHDQAEKVIQQAEAALWESQAAQEYLLGRGLEPDSWQRFRLGYKPDVFVPGTESAPQYAGAIVIPWTAKGKTVAIRYRFLQLQEGTKQTSRKGSDFTNRIFGAQALFGCAERRRWLLIVEGELNCVSVWQVCHDAGIDVVSIGSRSSTIPENLIEHAKKYLGVLVWLDEGDDAHALAARIPGAVAINSLKDSSGKALDANDLLEAGRLASMLALKRERHAADNAERIELMYTLLDAGLLPNGITTGEANLAQHLARQLGRTVLPLYQPQPSQDRWIMSCAG